MAAAYKDFGVDTTEVMFQAFNWTSASYAGKGGWYGKLIELGPEIADLGVTVVWFPPPSDSLSPQGYMPRDLDVLNSKYGSEANLKEAVSTLKSKGIKCLVDAVLNHRCASHKSPNGAWTQFGGKYNWDDRAVICNDPSFPGRGHHGTGVPLAIAPNIDHKQDFVKRDITDWLKRLMNDVGFEAFRIDYARGFSGSFVGEYMKATNPTFAVGEFWDGLEYDGSYMRPNQDAHRNRIAKWVDSADKMPKAFDFTTKGMMMQACKAGEFWRLKDSQNRPSGFIGIWPQKAVTFIDNHDTGSTQAHWPFPNDKVMQGYAYILTHPGLPTVFFDHVFDWKLKDQIKKLIEIRKEMGLTTTCIVKIEKADNVMYIARIMQTEDAYKQLYLKLGHGSWAPSAERGWKLRASGNGYAVWTRDSIPGKPTEPEPTLRRVVSMMKPFIPVPEGKENEEIPGADVAPPAPSKLYVDADAIKLRMENAGPGKKKLIMEYEIDEEMAINGEFTVALTVQVDEEVESCVKRL